MGRLCCWRLAYRMHNMACTSTADRSRQTRHAGSCLLELSGQDEVECGGQRAAADVCPARRHVDAERVIRACYLWYCLRRHAANSWAVCGSSTAYLSVPPRGSKPGGL